MKNTGIVRKLDSLGRVVLPIDVRRALEIDRDDAVEIYVDSEYIILKKNVPTCIFCSNEKTLTKFKDKYVCSKCSSDIKRA